MTFFEIITSAISDIELHGYDSEERVYKWAQLLRKSIDEKVTPMSEMNKLLVNLFTEKFKKETDIKSILKRHYGVKPYTIQRIKPQLHAELNRRIAASANLIKLNREEMIERTMRRFNGWATSVPAGGQDIKDKQEIKNNLSTPLKNLSFEERRVMIDQGHKLVSNINDIVATGAGAIAGEWNSHWKQPGYNYRIEHKERDGKIYAIRGSWAITERLINKGAGYTDEMTAPGEEVFCRCSMKYIYSLNKLPTSMLTKKGKDRLKTAKELRNAI